MSGFKGTPGPWFVDHNSPFLVRANDDVDGRHIAHIGPANYTPRFDLDEPNAQLISAAPELLEALRDCLSFLERDLPTASAGPEIRKARAAIAKALGEQK